MARRSREDGRRCFSADTVASQCQGFARGRQTLAGHAGQDADEGQRGRGWLTGASGGAGSASGADAVFFHQSVERHSRYTQVAGCVCDVVAAASQTVVNGSALSLDTGFLQRITAAHSGG